MNKCFLTVLAAAVTIPLAAQDNSLSQEAQRARNRTKNFVSVAAA